MFVPLAAFFRATRWRLFVLALVASASLLAFLSLGHLITRLDPVEHADAIYVLAGSRTSRMVEAHRLYREGYAPKILLSPGDLDYEESALVLQGVPIQTEGDRQRDVLLHLGVPAGDVIILDALVDNTAQEADAIKTLVESKGWRALIVIGDRSTSRRVGYAFRRILGARTRIIVTANRSDPFDPGRWWATRWGFRSTFYEAPKLIAYWLGLRG